MGDTVSSTVYSDTVGEMVPRSITTTRGETLWWDEGNAWYQSREDEELVASYPPNGKRFPGWSDAVRDDPAHVIHNQDEFDRAVADHASAIDIDNTDDTPIVIRQAVPCDDDFPCLVTARGKSNVTLRKDAVVIARDYSRIVAYDKSRVAAHDLTDVEAYDDSCVDAYDSSTVWSQDHSHVWAHDDVKIIGRGHSNISLYDNSRASAWDSCYVVASDPTRVWAHDDVLVANGGGRTVHAGGAITYDNDLPDTDPVSPSGEVFVPAGTTTTADGRTVPRRGYVRRKREVRP